MFSPLRGAVGPGSQGCLRCAEDGLRFSCEVCVHRASADPRVLSRVQRVAGLRACEHCFPGVRARVSFLCCCI